MNRWGSGVGRQRSGNERNVKTLLERVNLHGFSVAKRKVRKTERRGRKGLLLKIILLAEAKEL